MDDDDPPPPRGDALLRDTMMRAHSAARAAVHIAPLAWDTALAADALDYARTLASTGQFRHSKPATRSRPEGENLWMGTRGAFSYADMAGGWSNERRYYMPRVFPDISTTGNWADVGHYSQMIWRDTKSVGCGLASSGNDDYLVCRYAPPGNVFGQKADGTP